MFHRGAASGRCGVRIRFLPEHIAISYNNMKIAYLSTGKLKIILSSDSLELLMLFNIDCFA
jgi:hypothetical protein